MVVVEAPQSTREDAIRIVDEILSSPQVLHEEVLTQNGGARRVRRYLLGRHPERGLLVQPEKTWTGEWETIEEKVVITPVGTINFGNTQ